MYLRIGIPFTGTKRGFRDTPKTNEPFMIKIPDDAISVMLWFERPGAKKTDPPSIVGGRFIFAKSDTKPNIDEGYAEHPPEVIVWPIAMRRRDTPSYLHATVVQVGDSIVGSWLYQ